LDKDPAVGVPVDVVGTAAALGVDGRWIALWGSAQRAQPEDVDPAYRPTGRCTACGRKCLAAVRRGLIARASDGRAGPARW